MISYFANRFVWGFVTFLAISAITFFLMNLVPGGPFATLETGRTLPPEVIRTIEHQYGLDKPLGEQYLIYMNNLLHGNFGHSIARNESVTDMLAHALPKSLTLGAAALTFAILLGIPLGVVAAVYKGSWIDWIATFLSIFAVCTPGFVLGMMLILLFSLKFGLLPVGGWGSWQQAILPIVALSLEPLAVIIRYTRSSMLEVLNQLYVTAARSKGIPEKRVIYKHALKNALIPVITAIGLQIPTLLIGSFLVETIFAIPGSGRFFVTAVSQRDYPVIMSVAILYGWIVTGVNISVDFIYYLVDPRLRS